MKRIFIKAPLSIVDCQLPITNSVSDALKLFRVISERSTANDKLKLIGHRQSAIGNLQSAMLKTAIATQPHPAYQYRIRGRNADRRSACFETSLWHAHRYSEVSAR